MLPRKRATRGFLGTAVTIAAFAEVAVFCGCYYYYRRLNRSQEYRYWMYQNFRPALEAYYKTGEMFGDNTVRTYDYETWGVEE